MSSSLSERIAEWVMNFSLSAVPQAVIESGKLHIIDAIGCAIAAVKEPHALMMRNAFLKMHGKGTALLWGTDDRALLEDAVIYNAGLIHGMDYDDTHALAITHPSASVVAAAFTLGEAMHASGKDVLEAVILGYEIILRLGIAAKGRFHDVGFHPTGLLSPFGAVCIAAKLKQASRDQLKNALGLCGSQAAAIQEYLSDGTWNKKLHPGWGIHSALYALALAQEGFLGTTQVFEGRQGFYQTHIGSTDEVIGVFADLGKRWRTSEIAFKFFPTCHWTHTYMQLLLEVMEERNLQWDGLESVECFIDPRGAESVVNPVERKKCPETEYQLRFSLFYAMAVIAVRKKLTLDEINMDLLKDTSVREMMDRIKITIDPTAEVKGHFPGKISVVLKSGERICKEQKYEMGCVENPAPEKMVINKFMENGKALPEDVRRKIISKINGLGNGDNIGSFLECLCID